MNAYDRKILLKAYREKVSGWLRDGKETAIRNELDTMRETYHKQLETNIKSLAARVRINKALTRYVTERYQIIEDAYIYNIDPLTGLKVRS
jgi:hypothetical protein